MKPLKLQTRVTLWSSLVVAIGLLLSGGLTALVVQRGELSELDDQIRGEAERFFTEYERKGATPERISRSPAEVRGWLPVSRPPRLVEIADSNDTVLYRSKRLLNDSLTHFAAGYHRAVTAKGMLRVGVFERHDLTIRIAADLAPVEDLTREVLLAFLAALPVLLIFAFVGGRWIAGKALEPIREIARSATKVTAQHLERRVPLPGSQDEVEDLAIVLNRTLERLESSFHQAVRFSADASHELRTPVTVLRSGLEALLPSPNLTDAEQIAVSGLLEQTQRISSIISSLLLLARADAGRLAVKSQSVNLRRIVELCLEDARIVAEAEHIQIETNLPARAMVRGDSTRLMQIISNLLDNAIKYNRTQGLVRVVLAAQDGSWNLDVSNTGPGILQEQRDHLFDRFFRGEHFAEIGGQGLGLSLARELARAHGGTLELVESDASVTRFRLTIAVAALADATLIRDGSEFQVADV
jgi:signal transduction histidine kinase